MKGLKRNLQAFFLCARRQNLASEIDLDTGAARVFM
jgi:hypothetical protein